MEQGIIAPQACPKAMLCGWRMAGLTYPKYRAARAYSSLVVPKYEPTAASAAVGPPPNAKGTSGSTITLLVKIMPINWRTATLLPPATPLVIATYLLNGMAMSF